MGDVCFIARVRVLAQALNGDPECAAALYNLNTALRMAGRQGEAVAFSWQWISERLPTWANCAESDERVGASSAAVVGKPPCLLVTGRSNPSSVTGGASGGPISATPCRRSSTRPSPPTATAAPTPADKSTSSCNSVMVSTADFTTNFTASPGPTTRPAGCEISSASSPESYTDSTGLCTEVECIDTAKLAGIPGGSGTDTHCLTVACVRWGDKYGVEYVKRLARGVRRNLGRSHKFVCFTDDVEALVGMEGVETKPLGMRCLGWRGWWNKAFLFSRYCNADVLFGRL